MVFALVEIIGNFSNGFVSGDINFFAIGGINFLPLALPVILKTENTLIKIICVNI